MFPPPLGEEETQAQRGDFLRQARARRLLNWMTACALYIINGIVFINLIINLNHILILLLPIRARAALTFYQICFGGRGDMIGGVSARAITHILLILTVPTTCARGRAAPGPRSRSGAGRWAYYTNSNCILKSVKPQANKPQGAPEHPEHDYHQEREVTIIKISVYIKIKKSPVRCRVPTALN